MGADLYITLKKPKIWGFERSQRVVDDGYFRDAYNDGSILRKYDLSWWADIAKLQDQNGIISVKNARKFLAMLEKHETIFAENISPESNEAKQYFQEGATLLKQFLQDAIKLDSPIEASL